LGKLDVEFSGRNDTPLVKEPVAHFKLASIRVFASVLRFRSIGTDYATGKAMDMTNDEQPSKRIRFAVLLSVLPLICISCRGTSQSFARSQEARDDDRLDIIYQAHSAAGPIFSPVPTAPSKVSPFGITQVSAEFSAEPAPFPDLSWSKPELRIEYPPPDGGTDHARVTLYFLPVDCGRQCDRLSWSEQIQERVGLRRSRVETFRERWSCDRCRSAAAGSTIVEMDLPRSELDGLLSELRSHGYFEGPGRMASADSAAHLEVRLNRHRTSKAWKHEPALDELTARVYREGRFRKVSAENSNRPGLSKSRPWVNSIARSK
jgi:hypothetical protein